MEPETASFSTTSAVIVPSTAISICLIPSFPFKYSSRRYSIPVFPIMSFWLYVSFFCWYSVSLIFEAYPKMCDANVPSLYCLTGWTVIFIPGKSSPFSENSAIASLGMSFAIVSAFVLLYPSFTIAYLIAIIFLTSVISSFLILYLSLNL